MKGSAVAQLFLNFVRVVTWIRGGYASPSPHYIKQACLARICLPDAKWVETGTYLGSTTKMIAKLATEVHSIEPQLDLYLYNKEKFSKNPKINLYNSTSELAFPEILPKLQGNLNFWLDGHFSGGDTFLGSEETPIRSELESIAENLDRLGSVIVFVDDVRCFNPSLDLYGKYPDTNYLVSWASNNGFSWTIEHDIFIATRIV